MSWLTDNIKEYLDENVHEADYPIREVAEDLEHIVDEYEKDYSPYRWHDLRKNSDDLPEDMENVQICWSGGSNNWYDSMFWDADRKVFSINGKTEFEVIHPVIGDKRYAAYGEAIAWRYIEPFEEVE